MAMYEVYLDGQHSFNICCKDGELPDMLSKMAFLTQTVTICDSSYRLWFQWNGKYLVPTQRLAVYHGCLFESS